MSISDKITSITGHLQDDYTALEQLGVSVEDRNIENIKDMANQIYAKFPKTSYAEGSNITLSNTLKGKLDFEDGIVGYGDTEQYTTEGYQLWNITDGTYSNSGITAVVKNGEITLNGTASATAFVNIPISTNITWQSNTNYTIYGFNPVENTNIRIRINGSGGLDVGLDSANRVKTVLYNVTDGQTYNFTLRVQSGQVLNNFILKPMLIIGSDTTKAYEPYTNGASPNPSYPQDIEVVRGKNIANTNLNSLTINGVTLAVNDDKKITCNGTATSTIAVNILNNNGGTSTDNLILPKGTYTLSGCPSGGGSNTNYKLDLVKAIGPLITDIGSGATYTTDTDEKYSGIRIVIYSGTTCNNLIFKPMLEKGSQATSYLPYNTLEVVERGINEINVEYPTTTAYGVTCTKNGDGTYTFNGTAERDLYFDICYFTLPVGTHKLVGCPSGGSWNNYIQYIRREDGQTFSINDSGSGGTGEVVGSEGQLRLSIMIKSGYACSNLLFKPMVTKDTSLTYADFEPYQTPQTYQLSLGEYEFAKIGNYVDTIEYDVENDKVYKNEKIGKVVLNGSNTENWERRNTNTSDVYRFYCSNYENTTRHATDNSEVALIYCDKFIPTSPNDNYNKTNGLTISVGGGIFIYYDTTNAYTTTEFKTWLSTHNLILYYILATATREEITGTLKDQIKALYNSHSFTGTTIIEIDGQLPLIIKVRALKGE